MEVEDFFEADKWEAYKLAGNNYQIQINSGAFQYKPIIDFNFTKDSNGDWVDFEMIVNWTNIKDGWEYIFEFFKNRHYTSNTSPEDILDDLRELGI